MNICEATKKALEENKCIREKPYKVKVKPIKGECRDDNGSGWEPSC